MLRCPTLEKMMMTQSFKFYQGSNLCIIEGGSLWVTAGSPTHAPPYAHAWTSRELLLRWDSSLWAGRFCILLCFQFMPFYFETPLSCLPVLALLWSPHVSPGCDCTTCVSFLPRVFYLRVFLLLLICHECPHVSLVVGLVLHCLSCSCCSWVLQPLFYY